jgi:predicted DNA-binding transcriptional regulator YafY
LDVITFLRRLEILNYLKTKRSSIGTEQILQHLIDAGYLDTNESKLKSQFRLIQRDLAFLLGGLHINDDAEDKTQLQDEYDNDFGLLVEPGEGKSRRWRLDPYQQLNYDFERMPAFMALALSVTQKHLTQVLPTSTQHELKRIFRNAEAKLQKSEQKLSHNHYQRLTDSVEFFQRGQRLQTPQFDLTILDTIYRAILEGKRINVSYRGQTGNKDYELHPFGVAIMLPKLYLIAMKHEDIHKTDEDENFRSFLIHKIENIDLSNQPNNVPSNFKIKTYLDQGNMDVLLQHSDSTHYSLIVELTTTENSSLLSDLKESPISTSQSLTKINDTTWHLKADVKRTIQLKNWLLSLGFQAKVLSPDIIRNDLITTLDAIRENYNE